MIERIVIVKNEAGIHCRPSSEILLAVQNFSDCEVRIETDNGNVEINSILALLGLCLGQGDSVKVIAEGKDEGEVCNKIADLFAFEFDFPSE